MKFRLSRKNWIPQVIILFIIAEGLFSKYIEHTTLWNWTSVLLFVLAMISKHNRVIITKKNVGMTLSFLAATTLLVIGVFFAESNEQLIDNLLTILYPLVICLLVMYASSSDFITVYLERAFIFFNIIWIINLVVLFLQVQGTGFLIKSNWLQINNYYQDHCSGLFGMSGTHELSMFSIFMLVYNLYYCDYKIEARSNKRKLVIYILVTEILMLVFSVYNENTALFALLPGFVILYYLLKIEWTNRNISQRIAKYSLYIIIAVVLIGVVLAIPSIRNYIQESFFDRLNRVLVFEALQTNGSNERLAIPYYALSHSWGWHFGKGFGAWRLHLGGYLGFRHFGLSSVGSFITLGGFWFYIFYTSSYASILKAICAVEENKSKLWIVCMIVVIILTMYTILYSSTVCSLWIAMTFLMFGKMYQKIKTESMRK